MSANDLLYAALAFCGVNVGICWLAPLGVLLLIVYMGMEGRRG